MKSKKNIAIKITTAVISPLLTSCSHKNDRNLDCSTSTMPGQQVAALNNIGTMNFKGNGIGEKTLTILSLEWKIKKNQKWKCTNGINNIQIIKLKKMKNLALILFFLLLLSACNNKEKAILDNTDEIEQNLKIVLEEKVFSKEEQQALKPEIVLERLIKGNERFKKNSLTARNHSAQVRNSVQGQYPKAVILSCLDSRIPVEDVFDKGIGDLFVARVAGNFANPEILGSMEFACYVAGAKLIVVMGHQHCGAVKASIDNVQLGNIAALSNGIRPAVEMAVDYTGEKSSKNDPYVHYVSKKNVLHTVDFIRKNSPILKDMEEKGQIKIVGAMYQMETGNVEFYK